MLRNYGGGGSAYLESEVHKIGIRGRVRTLIHRYGLHIGKIVKLGQVSGLGGPRLGLLEQEFQEAGVVLGDMLDKAAQLPGDLLNRPVFLLWGLQLGRLPNIWRGRLNRRRGSLNRCRGGLNWCRGALGNC